MCSPRHGPCLTRTLPNLLQARPLLPAWPQRCSCSCPGLARAADKVHYFRPPILPSNNLQQLYQVGLSGAAAFEPVRDCAYIAHSHRCDFKFKPCFKADTSMLTCIDPATGPGATARSWHYSHVHLLSDVRCVEAWQNQEGQLQPCSRRCTCFCRNTVM